MKRISRNVLVLATLTTLTGCATTAPMLAPQVTMPAAWSEPAHRSAGTITADWWHAFGSAELHALIEAALAGSPDLAIATERVRQAEAQAGIASASLFPALHLGLGTSARRVTGNGDSQTVEASSAVLNATYEVDLWGRNAAAVRGAQATLQATAYDRDAARLTLLAGVANGYFQLVAVRSRLAIARENLAIAERVHALVSARARNGAVSPLDVARQEATVLSQRAAIEPLEQQERQTLAALAVLTGAPPQGYTVHAADMTGLTVPTVDPGLPSDVLLRRPDLAAAEAQLAAGNANLAAARAALLPGIPLTGSAGTSSAALLSFLNAPASSIGFTLSLLQPIFDGGRLRGQVDVAASRERELVESYRKAILAALADVENALVAVHRTARQEVLQDEARAHAADALRLAEIRYREGVDDLLTVLDAQRTLFQAQDQLAQLRLGRLQAALSLYKALGGGWGREYAGA